MHVHAKGPFNIRVIVQYITLANRTQYEPCEHRSGSGAADRDSTFVTYDQLHIWDLASIQQATIYTKYIPFNVK